MPSRSRTALVAAVSAFSLFAISAPAAAAETASSELVIIREGDTVDDDLYATGVRVIIEGTVDGDLVAFAAEEVTISGEVTGSVLALAPTVRVSGEVGGALRASASVLDLTGTVGGDLVAAAFRVGLQPGSEVGGDVVAWAVAMTASGVIGSNLEGTQRALELEGVVSGDVDVSVGRMTITGPLEVGGDLGYRSEDEAQGLEQATVEGVVVHKSPLPPNIRVRALGLLARFLVVLGLTAAAVLVAWGWPERSRRAADKVRRRFVRCFGYGSLVMLSPVLLGAVAALIVGLAPAPASLPLLAILGPLILASIGLVLALSLVAGMPAVLAAGEALPTKFGVYGSILAGSVLAGLVWLVPLVGWLVPLLVLPTGLGGWILSFRPDPEPQSA
jgi:cytoskeletal protein CcmA (bactofilin family)